MSAHWAEKWLGRGFDTARYDCMDFVAEVLAAEFDRRIRVPPRSRGDMRGMAREIADLGGEVAVPRIGPPQEGDGVLMRPLGSRLGGCHIGLHTAPAGEPHVLHCVEVLGAVHVPTRTLPHRGWEVEGIYRWL